jgi:hypothetical protein
VDQVWCLGDLVGGGPDPARVIDLARECDLVLLGNHDAWMLEGRMWQDERALLDESQRAWLAALEPAAVRHGLHAWHGSPKDPLNGFLTSQAAATALPGLPPRTRGVVGHTHEPAMWTYDGTRPTGTVPSPWTPMRLSDGVSVIANPGAVAGTSLDRAAWWVQIDADEESFSLVWRRVRAARPAVPHLHLP